MPSDTRDELVDPTGTLNPIQQAVRMAVIDSIPPGSFKNEKEEWVRLEEVPEPSKLARALATGGLSLLFDGKPKRVYTEVDRAE